MSAHSTQAPERFEGLERSCRKDGHPDIVSAPTYPGLERIEASFRGAFFEPHAHDTYAIGVTLDGVQTFRYRGAKRFSTPGRILVLHPDEIHDGSAGTDEGLRYRMLYLAPTIVRRVLGSDTASLPFVASPVIEDKQFLSALVRTLGPLDTELTDLQANDLLTEITLGLIRHSQAVPRRSEKFSYSRAEQARDYLHENPHCNVASETLEAITGLDRFALSRHFRAAFGTSPHRYLIMRRLDQSRKLMAQGHSLAETAAATGFADQSHFTRHFKRSFGITPGKWAQVCSAPGAPVSNCARK